MLRRQLLFACCFLATACFAKVQTDGSVGPKQSFTGTFNIPASLGKQKGGNLFHSFDTFNLSKGEIATFTADGATGQIQNVIARVTGGTASSIDGTIACNIPDANFYFVNPSGVMFGPGASLDMKGSFAVTTADYLKHQDGTKFNSHGPAGSLTSAPPVAFGFLAAAPAGITLNGPVLTVGTGKTLTMVGGSVAIQGGGLRTPGGRVEIVTPATPGEVVPNVKDPDTLPATPGVRSFGPVTMVDNAAINTSGNSGGAAMLRAGNLSLQYSSIFANNTDGLAGRAIIASVTRLQLIAGGNIFANTIGPGNGGDIFVAARTISIDGSATPEFPTGIDDISAPRATGSAGNLTVRATNLAITGGGEISTNTYGSGHSGGLNVRTGNLSITGGSDISSSTFSSGHGGDLAVAAHRISINGSAAPTLTTGITAQSAPVAAGDAGDAGNVTVRTTDLSIINGGVISTGAFGSGHGGNLAVTARRISIGGAPTPTLFTGISGAEDNPGATGDAGDITVRTTDLLITGGGEISASTSGIGHGGDLQVIARTISIDGAAAPTGLTVITAGSETGATGDAGNLTIRATDLSITGGGQISADNDGTGHAGNLAVTAHRISIDGSATPTLSTEISTDGITADAGNLAVRTTDLSIMGGGRISASTFGAGSGGDIAVTADRVVVGGLDSTIAAVSNGSGAAGSVRVSGKKGIIVSGGGTIDASSSLSTAGSVEVTSGGSVTLNNGSITAQAQQAAGNVTVSAPLFVRLLNGSAITTNSGAGNGGNIKIDPLVLLMDSQSQINANAPKGTGGNITVNATRTPGLVLTGPTPNMTATGKAGTSGTIADNPANTDITSALARLPSSLISSEARLQAQCGVGSAFSSFLVTGTGGISSPAFWFTAPVPDNDDPKGSP